MRDRNRWIALVVLCTGMLMIVLDMTIVNVALPSIQADLGFSQAGLAWVVTGAMLLSVFTIVDPAAQQGWLAVRTLSLGAGSLALLGAFIVRQKTARHPLMPLRIFSSRAVTAANLVQVLGTAGMFGMFFLGSLYLRRILGYDPLQIGLAFLPVAVVMGALSVRYADRLVMRFGARRLLFPGLGLIAAGLALFAMTPADGTYLSYVFPVTLLIGTGAGLCFPALMTLAMSSATRRTPVWPRAW